MQRVGEDRRAKTSDRHDRDVCEDARTGDQFGRLLQMERRECVERRQTVLSSSAKRLDEAIGVVEFGDERADHGRDPS